MAKKYVFSLDDASIGPKGGSKSKNLRFLIKHGFPVPVGWVVSWDALKDFRRDDKKTSAKLYAELSDKLSWDSTYAVRSSAAVEDAVHFSCAGLFCSKLDLKGIDQIMKGVLDVWNSMGSNEFLTYCKNHAIEADPTEMGVIIQKMVPAVCSGIIFSKNPMTGLSETIIELAKGNNEQQIAMMVNPERWISKWGNWIERPDTNLIDEATAEQLVRLTEEVVKKFKKPIDLEWAYDGEHVHFLQVRPITQLDIPVYSNKITKEMLPGLIKPLVWSVNTQLINKIWVDILVSLTGDQSIQPDMLTEHFYSRAYFNMALFGRVFENLGMPYEALELLLGLEMDGPTKPHMRPGPGFVLKVPRVLRFAFRFLSSERPFKKMLMSKEAAYKQIIEKMVNNQTPQSWLDSAKAIFEETESVAYFNIVIPMQMMMIHRFLSGQLKKAGYDVRDLKLIGVDEAAKQFSPHFHLEQLKKKYGLPDVTLNNQQQMQLEIDVMAFLEQFGHFSDSGNDCSSVPWRETPELIHQMLLLPSFHSLNHEDTVQFSDLELPLIKKWFIGVLYRRTSRFAVHREAISSLYTFGYGQFRRCFVGLGAWLKKQGIIDYQDDVYYFYWQELNDLIKEQDTSPKQDLISHRKATIDMHRDISVPELIFGDEEPPINQPVGTVLRGIPTSLGMYTGPAKVIKGIHDIEKLNKGDVLIIPYSDVGWTPLFALANAVIAESGGILSHSSIVAREYHIPAVVSVQNACNIPDGAMITVNGYTGEILFE